MELSPGTLAMKTIYTHFPIHRAPSQHRGLDGVPIHIPVIPILLRLYPILPNLPTPNLGGGLPTHLGNLMTDEDQKGSWLW